LQSQRLAESFEGLNILQHNRWKSYGVGKWRKNSSSCRILKYDTFVQYTASERVNYQSIVLVTY